MIPNTTNFSKPISLMISFSVSVCYHIVCVVISNMVHNNVHNYTNTVCMTCLNKFTEFIDSTHILIHKCPVKCVISVECIMWEFLTLSRYPSVYLFIRSCNPNSVNTKLFEVIHVLCETFYISTVECSYIFITT